MANFNGNARDPEAKYIPAEHYMRVADVISTLTRNGVPIRDLHVQVNKGSLQLGDDTGSYGVHMWDA